MPSTTLGPRDPGVEEADPFSPLTHLVFCGRGRPTTSTETTDLSGCAGPVRNANEGLRYGVTGQGLIPGRMFRMDILRR